MKDGFVYRIRAALISIILGTGSQGCLENQMRPIGNLSSASTAMPLDTEATLDNIPAPTTEADPKADLRRALQPNLVADCRNNPGYNACIFWKNPVAQQGRAFTVAVNRDTDLNAIQIHAVNLSGYDDSGVLKNDSFHVRALTPEGQLRSISTLTGDFKFEYRNDPLHSLGQAMAFYWLDFQEKYMTAVTGAFYASKKAIDVISYVPNLENAYWDSDQREVVMGSSPDGNEFALGAEIYAHEMGHANVFYATGGKINETVGSFSSVLCGGGRAVCCADANGCSWAINEGLADYHSGILFSSNTSMGETYVNDVDGFSECSLPRGMDANRGLTAQAAYNACALPIRGEVHVTGRIYASVWWEVRKKAESVFPAQGTDEIDTLFTQHLPALDGRDTFVSAKDKILATDRALYNGKYSDFFSEEFGRRGIQ